MKTLLTKGLAVVKGWFASPDRQLGTLTIFAEDGTAYTVEEILEKFRKVRETDARYATLDLSVKVLTERANGAVENERRLASRIGHFQAAHPELHAEFFTSKGKPK